MRPAMLYTGMLVLAAFAVVGVVQLGDGLVAPKSTVEMGEVARKAGGSSTAALILALTVVVVSARVCGSLARRYLGQPAVVGEIAAGILLGPSALRALWPELGEGLIAPSALPPLKSLSQLGVVLFMFLVGVGLDTRLLVGRAREAIAVSHASIVAPFVLGVAAALWLYPRYGVSGTGFGSFALFCGAALSVTAFPVLARILADQGLTRTPLGVTAIACAAADDVTAWALLAGVVALAKVEYEAFLTTFVGICAYGVLVVAVLRPALRKLESATALQETTRFAALMVLVLFSAWCTETAGVHALFGAFVLGALIPTDGALARCVEPRLQDAVSVLLLPTFFVVTGLRTDVGGLSTADDLWALALIFGVATLGKLGGTWLAGLAVGMTSRRATALGLLMNTRGLMGLVVLDVGLGMGLLSPQLYTLFVLVALATTALTGPLVKKVIGHDDAATLSPEASGAGDPR